MNIYRTIYSLIEHNIKEYFRSCNARKTTFSCENDWHDDSMHGSLPNSSFSKRFIRGLSKNYRFLFWQSLIASLHKVSIIVVISWPYLYDCTPIIYSDIVFVGQNICCIISWCQIAHIEIWVSVCECIFVL